MVKMKDSGIEWIGEIPEDWKSVKFNAIYNLRTKKVSDKDFPPLSVTKKGIVPQLDTAAKTNDGDNRKLVKKGDFAINSRSDRRGSCGISKYDGSVSLINTVLFPRNSKMDPRYYDWLFHTTQFADEFYKWGHGIVDDLWTTNWQDMKNITLILPPLSQQQIIADFLDKKCTEIDDISAKIQKEIDTLEEYRKSVITKAITKGLNDKVLMKDSGIEWMGKIPREWKIGKLKFFVEVQSSKKSLEDMNGRYIGLENVEKNSGKYQVSNSKYDPGIYDSCEKGDILYGKLRPNLAKVIIAPFDACCTGEFEVLKAHNFQNEWIKYYLLSDGVTKMATAATYGTKMPRVNWDFVSNLPLPIPSNDEIDKITDYLDTKTTEIDKVILQKQKQLSLLSDYKNSLIFEYVTGKKQVPSVGEE
jgi:type I restriction enzyme S subunit